MQQQDDYPADINYKFTILWEGISTIQTTNVFPFSTDFYKKISSRESDVLDLWLLNNKQKTPAAFVD